MTAKVILDKIRSKVTKGQEWLVDNIQYLTLMGSHAYGTHHENSDFDVYGFTIPPKEYIYPNFINGFERPSVFEQFLGKIEATKKKECLDFQIYNITKYFRLVLDNNPNMIDSLFSRSNCELIVTDIGRKVKENRQLFLHKGMWQKFKGYSHSQLSKIRTLPEEKRSPERRANIEKYGYDVKFAVHIFRLLDEVEQLLLTGDLDLMRNREQLKSVLKGYYTLEEVDNYFKETESRLAKVYDESSLPYGPRTEEVRRLLVECLDEFYNTRKS